MSTIRHPQSLIHNPPEPGLQARFQELNTRSSRTALALAARGKKAGICGFVFAPFLTFLRVYLWHGQWRQGIAGLVSALFAAYEVFVRYCKLWELRHNQPGPPPRL
jgi:hypothetical protein